MSRYDIQGNNLVYKSIYGTFIMTNKNNKAKPTNSAIINIIKDKTMIYNAIGTVQSTSRDIYTIKINETIVNTLFPNNPEELYLHYKDDTIRKLSMFDKSGKPIQIAIGLFQLSNRDSYTLTPSIMNICKNCQITVGIKKNRNSLANIPNNLRQLAERRNTATIVESRNMEEEVISISDSDSSNIEDLVGGRKRNIKRKPKTKMLKGGNGMCGKLTKAGMPCQKRGNCPYH